MTQSLAIAFIGGGNMAQAMGRGIAHKQGYANNILVIGRNEDKFAFWKQLGAQTQVGVNERLGDCKVWILAVKPQQLKEVCLSIKPFLKEDTLVISVAAGISLASLEQWLGHATIIRTMPNTPSLIGKGVTGMYVAPAVSATHSDYAQELLETMGMVVKVKEESLIDAVIAVSGSGPAYIYLMIESMVAAGIKMGLSQEQALEMTTQTVLGAAQMVASTGESPAKLRENVSSKGGTTLAALNVFYNHEFPAIVEKAMQAAVARAAELSIELGK